MGILPLFVLILSLGCKSQPGTQESEFGDIRDIFAGAAGVFILKTDNTLWGAGYNRRGQFGQGDAGLPLNPHASQITDDTGSPFSDVKSVAAGESHTVILKEDGTLWGAGDSSQGELGQGGGRLRVFTRLMALGYPLTGINYVAAGNNCTFFINDDGILWASGYNYYGELGLGNRDNQSSFRTVENAGQNVKAVASGLRHTVLLKEDGTIWASGYNFHGQLGFGDTEDRNSFTQVSAAGSGISAVAAGNYHTVILKSDGTVWAAGSNYWGQLGSSGGGDQKGFSQLSDEKGSISGIRDIAARGNLTVLIKEDGALLLAGNFTDTEGRDQPNYGAGEDNGQEKAEPGFIPLLPEDGQAAEFKGAKKVVLGYNSIYLIDLDNRLWAAGSNRYGQLGLDFDIEVLSALKLIN